MAQSEVLDKCILHADHIKGQHVLEVVEHNDEDALLQESADCSQLVERRPICLLSVLVAIARSRFMFAKLKQILQPFLNVGGAFDELTERLSVVLDWHVLLE